MPCEMHSSASAALTTKGSQVVAEALRLFDSGLNVFPIILGSKKPYGKHDFLNTTRLYRPRLAALVVGSNVAVMAGRLSGNLFVVDCDSLGEYERVKEAMAAHKLKPWIRSSVRGGQFWLRCADGEVKNGKQGDVDILGNCKYTVAPPSVHPEGMVYDWLAWEGEGPPVVSLTEMQTTLPFLKLSLVRRRCQPAFSEKANALPPVADLVLVRHNTSGYKSNSEAEYAACLSLIGAGYSDGHILHFFRSFLPPHFNKVGEDNFRQYVLEEARSYHEDTHKVRGCDAAPHSSTIMAWASSRAWPSRTGNTDRAVFLALCERMRMDGGMPFRASVREVSELAGVNKTTANRSLKRLQSTGFIHIESESGINTVTLILPDGFHQHAADKLHTVGIAYTPVGISVCTLSTNHDVWHRDALGKSALACWSVLLESPGLTKAEMAEQTGRHQRTVSRALDRLEWHLLVEQRERGHWHGLTVSQDRLDRIAAEKNTLGRAALRSSRNSDERARWASERIAQQIEQKQSGQFTRNLKEQAISPDTRR